MDPLSPAFAALVGLAIAADRGLRGAARDAALVAGAIVFFAASAGSWLTVATFTFAAALTLLGFRSLGVGRRATPWIVALAAILVAFKWLAASSTARGTLGLAAVALPLGVSYYVLRAIAALVDGARGGVRDARPLEVAGFLSFLPLLRLGPIERLGPYLRQRRDAVRARAEDVAEGALRIVEGAFKVLVVGEALRVAAEPLSLHLGAIPWERGVSWGSVYAYALYIYFDFSGASDLAIGTARLFGVKVIENFDLPYSRPNLAEFWRAWHVSLSSWLRDYLFFPLARRLPAGAAPFVAPLIVMGLCGLWHGFTLPYLVWGLLHGAGLSIHQTWLRARRAIPALDRACASGAGRSIATMVTVHYVAFTWLFFAAPDVSSSLTAMRALAASAGSSAPIIATALAIAALGAWLPRALASIPRRVGAWSRVQLAVVLFLLVAARFWLATTAPEGAFVYQGF